MTKRLRDDAFAEPLEYSIPDGLIGSTLSIIRPYEKGRYPINGDEEYEPTNKTPKRRKKDGIFASDSEDCIVRTKLELTADDLGTAIVQAKSLIQQLSITSSLKSYVSKEMESLERYQDYIEQGRTFNGNFKLTSLTKRRSLHETNNFIFLQLGYILSYEDEASLQNKKTKTWRNVQKCKGGSLPYYYSTSTDKCWETNRATPVLGLLQVLQKIHEYNHLRKYTTAKTKVLNRTTSVACFECTLPFQLENAELEELVAVLERVLGHALTNFNSSSSERETTHDKSSIEAKIERECLSELSLLVFESCIGLLQSMDSMNDWIKVNLNKKTDILEILVRIVLDTTRNRISLFEKGLKQNFETVRSQAILLLKNLTQASPIKDKTSTAGYIYLCAEIVMCFNGGNTSGPSYKIQTEFSKNESGNFLGHSAESGHITSNAWNVEHNLISLLQHICSSLRNKLVIKSLSEGEWDSYLDTISSMMKKAGSDDRLLENLFTVINYFAMSPTIAIPMSRHMSLLNSIANFATDSQNVHVKRKNTGPCLGLIATRCITLLAYQIVTSAKGGADIINMAMLLSKMTLSPGGIERQMELTLSLCLIMKQYPEALMIVVQKKGREELKNFLSRLAEIVEFGQEYSCTSYAAKEAATEIMIHILFNHDSYDCHTTYPSEIRNIIKRLIVSKDETSEAIYVQLMNERYLQSKRILKLGRENYFLNALAGITCNDSHNMVTKERAMCILASLSIDKLVSGTMIMNECVIHSLMSYLSLRGQNKGMKCCHFAIETIISISSFPPNREVLLRKSGLMGILVKLAKKIPEASVDNKAISSQASSTLKKRLKQAIEELISSI